MNNLVCIHGINKDEHCIKCVSFACEKLGRALAFSVPLEQAGEAMRKLVKAIPQEHWDMIDKELKRREDRKKKELTKDVLKLLVQLMPLVLWIFLALIIFK